MTDTAEWPAGSTFGELTPEQKQAAIRKAGARLTAELTAADHEHEPEAPSPYWLVLVTGVAPAVRIVVHAGEYEDALRAALKATPHSFAIDRLTWGQVAAQPANTNWPVVR